MASTHTVTTAAALTGLSVSSLRNYCTQFAPLLSEGASPGPGVERLLTDQDVAILQRCKELRRAGQTVDEVIAQLQSEDTGSLQTYIDVVAIPVVDSPQTALESPQLPAHALTAITALQKQMDAIQAAQVEANNARAGQVTMYVAGIITGLLVTAIVLALIAIVN